MPQTVVDDPLAQTCAERTDGHREQRTTGDVECEMLQPREKVDRDCIAIRGKPGMRLGKGSHGRSGEGGQGLWREGGSSRPTLPAPPLAVRNEQASAQQRAEDAGRRTRPPVACIVVDEHAADVFGCIDQQTEPAVERPHHDVFFERPFRIGREHVGRIGADKPRVDNPSGSGSGTGGITRPEAAGCLRSRQRASAASSG